MGTPVWFAYIIKKTFPYRHQVARLSKFPPFAKLFTKTIFNGDDIVYLPKDRVVIQQTIDQPGSTVLPSAVVDHFIEIASYHWVMNDCICREGSNCQDHPHDLGCLFLGEAALSINPKMGRLVSKEEAHAHMRRSRELGLVNTIGRDRIDSIWMGASPFGKLMTICSCCSCCCLWRVLPDLDRENRSKVYRLPGVEISVDVERCAGCGRCTRDACFINAIQMVDGKAQISAECRGCGRCVEVCPHNAIRLTISDPDYADRQIAHLSKLIDLQASEQPRQIQRTHQRAEEQPGD